jgi:hypothetical protein
MKQGAGDAHVHRKIWAFECHTLSISFTPWCTTSSPLISISCHLQFAQHLALFSMCGAKCRQWFCTTSGMHRRGSVPQMHCCPASKFDHFDLWEKYWQPERREGLEVIEIGVFRSGSNFTRPGGMWNSGQWLGMPAPDAIKHYYNLLQQSGNQQGLMILMFFQVVNRVYAAWHEEPNRVWKETSKIL